MNEVYKRAFENYIPDFFRYMLKDGNLARKTSRDYIFRLKYLSEYYLIDESIREERIEEILAQENVRRTGRSCYTNRKALTNFRAGLRKFLLFIKSDYRKRLQDSIIGQIDKVERRKAITITEKTAILQARIGQGRFRRQLIDYWQGCAISGCDITWMLVASHIKPWCDATNDERLDVFNGLLLLPNYDKLFDLGYMSFNLDGRVLYSRLLDEHDRKFLDLPDSLRRLRLEAPHRTYLKYHNDNCFLR